MRSNEIFADMSGEDADRFLADLKQDAPDVAKLALGVTAQAFHMRPEFLNRWPRSRQAELMRRALGRTIGAPLAEEVLATYFLDHEMSLLTELLDALGVPHDEGRLSQDEPPCPDPKTLSTAVVKFRKGDRPEKRDLLVRTFAAQSSINWPALDELLAGNKAPARKATARPKTSKPKATAKAKAATPARAKAKGRPKAKAKPRAKAKKKARKK